MAWASLSDTFYIDPRILDVGLTRRWPLRLRDLASASCTGPTATSRETRWHACWTAAIPHRSTRSSQPG